VAQKIRMIHPADAQDERLANLPLSAAYTYAYLPTVLDDDGRAKDQPSVFNGYLWPLRADTHPTEAMVSDLDALVAAGLLCRYTVNGQHYLHAPAWKSRQKIARPIASTLPGCPTHNKTFDEVVGDTLRKVSDQVNSFLGTAATGLDEAKIRESVARIVEDVSLVVDPERAASYGQKIRGFLAKQQTPPPPKELPTTGASGNGKDAEAGKATGPTPPEQGSTGTGAA
jgi:hypothetical protein